MRLYSSGLVSGLITTGAFVGGSVGSWWWGDGSGILGQAPIGTPDLFLELWNLAKGGTPLVVMLLIAGIYYTNAERKAVQTKYDVLLERHLLLGQETNSTLKEFRELFSKLFQVRGDRDG